MQKYEFIIRTCNGESKLSGTGDVHHDINLQDWFKDEVKQVLIQPVIGVFQCLISFHTDCVNSQVIGKLWLLRSRLLFSICINRSICTSTSSL